MNCVLDTNVLIDGIDLSQYSKVYIPITCIEELDNLKCNKDYELAYKAKQAIKQLEKADNIEIRWRSQWSIPMEMPNTNDNQILAFAKDCVAFDKECVFLTNDYNVRLKAKHLDIPCESYIQNIDKDNLYLGYKEVTLSEYEQALFYQEGKFNKWDLLNNQYLIIKNEDGEIIDKYRWTDEKGFVTLKTTSFKSIYFQDFKPKDVYQMLAMDSLYNTDFTLLFGRAGSAKTTLALSYVMQQIQANKINKCVIIYSNAPLRNNFSLGFYPGNRNEKLLSGSLGGILTSKFGDVTGVEALINQGKLLLIPSAEIRGIEVGEHDCLFVTEAQNTDAYTMRTILQRVKDGCKCIVEGDLLEQQDIRNCGLKENGMYRALEVFKGDKSFSCVKLRNVYRGHIADVAQDI